MVHRDTESLTITMTMTMTFLVGLRPRRPKGRGNEGARGRERTLVNIKNVSLTEGKDILPMKNCNSTTMAAIVFKLSVK